jgi:hypothetical protein
LQQIVEVWTSPSHKAVFRRDDYLLTEAKLGSEQSGDDALNGFALCAVDVNGVNLLLVISQVPDQAAR